MHVGAVSPVPQRNKELAVIPVPVSLLSGDKVMSLVTTPDAESAYAVGSVGAWIVALIVEEKVVPTTSEPV